MGDLAENKKSQKMKLRRSQAVRKDKSEINKKRRSEKMVKIGPILMGIQFWDLNCGPKFWDLNCGPYPFGTLIAGHTVFKE